MSILHIGSAPYEESCVQLGDKNYATQAKSECAAFKAQLLKIFKAAHDRDPLCTLRTKKNHHEFGTYYDVVAVGSTDSEIEDAFWLEDNSPANWDPEILLQYAISKQEL